MFEIKSCPTVTGKMAKLRPWHAAVPGWASRSGTRYREMAMAGRSGVLSGGSLSAPPRWSRPPAVRPPLGRWPPFSQPGRSRAPGWLGRTHCGLDRLGQQRVEPFKPRPGETLLEEPPNRACDDVGVQRLARSADLGRHREQHDVAHLIAEESAASADQGTLGFRVSRLTLEREIRSQQAPQLRVATLSRRTVAVDGSDQLSDPLGSDRCPRPLERFQYRLDLAGRDTPPSSQADGAQKTRRPWRWLLCFSRDDRHAARLRRPCDRFRPLAAGAWTVSVHRRSPRARWRADPGRTFHRALAPLRRSCAVCYGTWLPRVEARQLEASTWRTVGWLRPSR
jgi:hypothetical protein